MNWIKRMFGGERARKLRVKVPTILQMEATECGAAALAMILAHYRLWAPLEKLRAECGVNRDGSNASCVLKAARGRGCTAKGVQMTPDAVKKAEYPLIIHWEFNHFVVLEGVKNGRAYLNDPAVGRRTVPWEEFRTSFTGIALKIRPGGCAVQRISCDREEAAARPRGGAFCEHPHAFDDCAGLGAARVQPDLFG